MITASAGLNGTITPSGAVTVAYGAEQTFTFSPAAGYQVAAVTVDGSPVAVGPSYTFSNVTADHTIDVQFALEVTAVAEDRPTSFGLRIAGANPAFGRARLELALPESAHVDVRIYDTRGRMVRRLATGSYEAGRHMLDWDARNEAGVRAGSGIYFAKLVVSGRIYRVRLV